MKAYEKNNLLLTNLLLYAYLRQPKKIYVFFCHFHSVAVDGFCALLQIGVGARALLDSNARTTILATLAAYATQASNDFSTALSVDGAPPLDTLALDALRALQRSTSDATLGNAASRVLRTGVVPQRIKRLFQLHDNDAKVVADGEFVAILVRKRNFYDFMRNLVFF